VSFPAQPDAASPKAGELRLRARTSELGAARLYAEDAAAAFGLDATACHEFAFAVNEAVTNAIRHGAPDAQGYIRLAVATRADRLTLAVQDYGRFLSSAVDRTISSEDGRGLTMMARMVDVQLCIGRAGTIVRLSKTRASTGPPTELFG
jgi:anti-sigma regulatory factor (Ser/Thr protein kinase)